MENKCSHRNCIQIFIVALFIIDKLWKQARCPLLGEWINKFWAIQTMEYYSALKGNELSSHEKAWRKLNGILLNERNESGKTTYYCTSPSGTATLKGSLAISYMLDLYMEYALRYLFKWIENIFTQKPADKCLKATSWHLPKNWNQPRKEGP